MSWIERYRTEIRAMLAASDLPGHTPCGVMFVTEDDLRELEKLGLKAVVLSAEDRETARSRWEGRPDPHGWAPSDTRTIAVIRPLV
jgi:hypothetical protein